MMANDGGVVSVSTLAAAAAKERSRNRRINCQIYDDWPCNKLFR